MKIKDLLSPKLSEAIGSIGSVGSSTAPAPTAAPAANSTTAQPKKLNVDQAQIMALGQQLKLTPQEVQTLSQIQPSQRQGQPVADPKSNAVLAKLGTMSLDKQKQDELSKVPSLIGLIGKGQQSQTPPPGTMPPVSTGLPK